MRIVFICVLHRTCSSSGTCKKHVRGRVDCFFKDEKIDEEDYADFKGYVPSSVGDLRLVSKKSGYPYVIRTRLKRTGYEEFSHKPRVQNEIVMIKVRDEFDGLPGCASCVATAVAHMNVPRRHISDIMCLPKEELEKVVQKKQ